MGVVLGVSCGKDISAVETTSLWLLCCAIMIDRHLQRLYERQGLGDWFRHGRLIPGAAGTALLI